MRFLTRGKLAKEAGINIETIRYYETRGLIPKPPRGESGYRRYPEETVARIWFIRRAKELGFSLKEISELLSLRLDPDTPSIEVRKRAEAKISDIDRRIQTLKGMREALSRLAKACDCSARGGECPILEELERPAGYEEKDK